MMMLMGGNAGTNNGEPSSVIRKTPHYVLTNGGAARSQLNRGHQEIDFQDDEDHQRARLTHHHTQHNQPAESQKRDGKREKESVV